MSPSKIADLRQQLSVASQQWQSGRAELAAAWADARAAAIDVQHLKPAEAAMAGQDAELAQQDEAAERALGLARLATEHADAADHHRTETETAVASAREQLAAVTHDTGQAMAAAAASCSRLDEALRLVGRAGAGCGQAVGLVALRADLDGLVRRDRVNATLRMAVKPAAAALAWQLGPKAVEAGLEAWNERLEGLELDALADQIQQHGPMMARQVATSVKDVLARLGRR